MCLLGCLNFYDTILNNFYYLIKLVPNQFCEIKPIRKHFSISLDEKCELSKVKKSINIPRLPMIKFKSHFSVEKSIVKLTESQKQTKINNCAEPIA